jgi:aryl-alcohol dehydrogenase-like predicted oxidoreductase
VIDHALALDKGILVKKALNSGHDCIAGDAVESSVGANFTERNLRFALDKEGVTSVIVGTINPKHLQENVEAVQ